MTSLFSTDPFFHSPSYDESSPDLSILQELEMEYGNESHMSMMAGNFLPTEEDVYSSPLSDASPISDAASPICDASPIPPFTVISPYDPIPTPSVKTESTVTHHIPILPFQSVTATRTAKKRRRFAGNPHLRSSDDEEKDDVSIGSSDSQSSSSSPTPTTTKKRKSGTNPAMGKRERNKVSASKYRKRRKMYLDTLEEKTNELEQKYVNVTEQNTQLDSENRVLKEQLAFLKSLLHTKGADMQTLEQTLAGDLSQTTPQQSSIFMFVLFSCFLLFNPMTWFTSTPSTSTQSTSLSSTRHITYPSRPSSVGHVGRNLLQHDFDTEMEMEDIMSKYDFMSQSQSIDILPKSMQMAQIMSQGVVVPTGVVPTSSESTLMDSDASETSERPMAAVLSSASAYVPLNVEPATVTLASAPTPKSAPKHIPLTGSPAVKSKHSAPKHVPLTGEPAALLSRRTDVDIDDPIRVHRVMQPVDKMQPIISQPLVINETALASKFNQTEVAAVREIIDMTKDTVDINDIKQLYQHVLTPLTRIMGETRAREAIQTLAQGILDIHLDSTEASMTRSGQAPTVY